MATTTGKTIKVKKGKKTTPKIYILEPDESKLEFIDFSRFTNIRVLEDGVCGLKVCCVIVELDGREYVLKEMRKSFNYGRDYILMDSLKSKFGLRDMKMRRIRSNRGLVVKDKAKKSFVGNWQWADREVVYCIMGLLRMWAIWAKTRGFWRILVWFVSVSRLGFLMDYSVVATIFLGIFWLMRMASY